MPLSTKSHRASMKEQKGMPQTFRGAIQRGHELKSFKLILLQMTLFPVLIYGNVQFHAGVMSIRRGVLS